jgi:hypothetical protein
MKLTDQIHGLESSRLEAKVSRDVNSILDGSRGRAHLFEQVGADEMSRLASVEESMTTEQAEELQKLKDDFLKAAKGIDEFYIAHYKELAIQPLVNERALIINFLHDVATGRASEGQE